MKKSGFMLVAIGAIFSNASAQLASDNASNAAYSGGWSTGENGGSGFGAWTALGTYDGTTATSIAYSSGLGAETWQIQGDSYAYGGGYATRALGGGTGGVLAVGETLSMDIYQQTLNSSSGNSSWGIQFKNASGQEDASFFGYFYNQFGITPDNDLFTASAAGNLDYGFGYGSPTGLHLALTVTSANTFSAAATPIGGSGGTVTGTFENAGPITQINMFSYATDPGEPLQIRDMLITPEPSSMLAVAGLAVLAARRRRKS